MTAIKPITQEDKIIAAILSHCEDYYIEGMFSAEIEVENGLSVGVERGLSIDVQGQMCECEHSDDMVLSIYNITVQLHDTATEFGYDYPMPNNLKQALKKADIAV